MKILYIGHYKEGTGWAQAAKDYILALDSIGVDVVCRNITLTKDNPVDNRILQLEKKSTDDCDYCIQHVLPHHLAATKRFKKNISFIALESHSIKNLTWFEYLKPMDEVWVPNHQLSNKLFIDGIKRTKVIPHCCDIEKYTKKYQTISIPQIDNKFKFYYIGDLNDRKNIRSIIRCFHSEFDKSENACLILKVKKFGHSPDQVKKIVDNILTEEKNKLRIYSSIQDYQKDVVLTEDLTDDQIYSIHQYADCFVLPSHGEAWSIPSFDAMAFGNTPICSNFGGPRDFIDRNDTRTGHCVEGTLGICQCSDAAFPEIFTGKEYWFVPSEFEVRQTMRFYYENKKDKLKYKQAGLERAKMFTYEKIAQLIKEYLSE